MMIDPNRVTLRPGNGGYLNIDYDNQEIGHLKLHLDGRIAESWAINSRDQPLVELIARCRSAVPHSPTRP